MEAEYDVKRRKLNIREKMTTEYTEHLRFHRIELVDFGGTELHSQSIEVKHYTE